MKPIEIKKVLDLARSIREAGGTFVPCFSGAPGLGKSKIGQAWAKDQGPDFKVIDLRLCYKESPDLVGRTTITKDLRTAFATPDFWPTEGEGLIMLEEFNRAPADVMNCLMQLTTDRTVGEDYKLPEGWVIAGFVNDAEHGCDVSEMDSALKSRFTFFDVTYDHKSFLNYIKEASFHPNVQAFVQSDLWQYKMPKDLGDQGTYLCPRLAEHLSDVEKAASGLGEDTRLIAVKATLGRLAMDYEKLFEDQTLNARDFLKPKAKVADLFKRLKKFSSKRNYKGDLIAMFVQSVNTLEASEFETFSKEYLVKVLQTLPIDHSSNLMDTVMSERYPESDPENLSQEGMDFLERLHAQDPKLIKRILNTVDAEGEDVESGDGESEAA